jgi:hypothetical protein
MTETLEHDAPAVDRDELARAIRAAAAAWDGPRLPEAAPRTVAGEVISSRITDQPRRGSAWLGDGQPGLTASQARAAVRAFVMKASLPGYEQRAFQAVLDALEGRLAVPGEHQPELPAGTPRCRKCGGPIPPERGPLARYCRNACRTAAWKARQRETARAAAPSPRSRPQSSGS